MSCPILYDWRILLHCLLTAASELILSLCDVFRIEKVRRGQMRQQRESQVPIDVLEQRRCKVVLCHDGGVLVQSGGIPTPFCPSYQPNCDARPSRHLNVPKARRTHASAGEGESQARSGQSQSWIGPEPTRRLSFRPARPARSHSKRGLPDFATLSDCQNWLDCETSFKSSRVRCATV